MELSAQAVELSLQRSEVDVQVWCQAEDGEVIAPGRRLNLAAVRAEQGGSALPD
jgi:hypothetical protein